MHGNRYVFIYTTRQRDQSGAFSCRAAMPNKQREAAERIQQCMLMFCRPGHLRAPLTSKCMVHLASRPPQGGACHHRERNLDRHLTAIKRNRRVPPNFRRHHHSRRCGGGHGRQARPGGDAHRHWAQQQNELPDPRTGTLSLSRMRPLPAQSLSLLRSQDTL